MLATTLRPVKQILILYGHIRSLLLQMYHFKHKLYNEKLLIIGLI